MYIVLRIAHNAERTTQYDYEVLMAEQTFEQLVSQLEKVVRQLEQGELSLDQSIAAFEEGVKLARTCEKKLQEAKGKIEQLVKDESGKTKVEPFEPKE